jgi:hypothetical protein
MLVPLERLIHLQSFHIVDDEFGGCTQFSLSALRSLRLREFQFSKPEMADELFIAYTFQTPEVPSGEDELVHQPAISPSLSRSPAICFWRSTLESLTCTASIRFASAFATCTWPVLVDLRLRFDPAVRDGLCDLLVPDRVPALRRFGIVGIRQLRQTFTHYSYPDGPWTDTTYLDGSSDETQLQSNFERLRVHLTTHMSQLEELDLRCNKYQVHIEVYRRE